jgi:hypothetical protein
MRLKLEQEGMVTRPAPRANRCLACGPKVRVLCGPLRGGDGR